MCTDLLCCACKLSNSLFKDALFTATTLLVASPSSASTSLCSMLSSTSRISCCTEITCCCAVTAGRQTAFPRMPCLLLSHTLLAALPSPAWLQSTARWHSRRACTPACTSKTSFCTSSGLFSTYWVSCPSLLLGTSRCQSCLRVTHRSAFASLYTLVFLAV